MTLPIGRSFKNPHKTTTRESTTSKTMSFPLSTWAHIEQIRSNRGYKTFEETIIKVVAEAFTAEGLGLP